MKVNSEVIERLRFSKTAKARLMYEFNVGPTTIWRWMNENEKYGDGDLTRAKAVRLIAEELGVSEDSVLCE